MALLNFRDVAGTPGLAPLQPGRLFRSAQPFHLQPDEVDLVLRSGIRTVIDLRDQREVVPPDWDPVARRGVRVVRVPLAEQVMAAQSGPLPEIRTVEEGHRFLGAFYIAVTEHARAGLAAIIDTVAAGEPVLLHCAAGKDRTGTAVALLLDLIGVPEDAIIADFLLTNRALPEVLAQLTSGVPAAEAVDPPSLPPGLDTAPEVAARMLLDHLHSVGGASNLLAGAVSARSLDAAIAALTAVR